jgi:membrane protein YqaA with SNARE-associated domain
MEYLSLLFSSFLSATLLPGSSEALLAGLIAMSGQPVVLLIAVATLGNTLGATVNWALGRLVAEGHQKIRLPITPEQNDKASRWFRRYRVWSLFFSWVPVVGDPLTAVAGLTRTPFALFLPVVAAGKAFRYLGIAGIVQWSLA